MANAKAADALLPLVYEELRKLAAARMANEAAGHTLQPPRSFTRPGYASRATMRRKNRKLPKS